MNNKIEVFFIDNSKGWIVGEGGLILKSNDGGITWTQKNSGTTARLSSVQFIDYNKGWILGDYPLNGVILKTINGGESWVQYSTGFGSDLKSIYFINNNVGWGCGYPGKIWKTTDGGINWTIQKYSNESYRFFSLCFTDINQSGISQISQQ